MKIKINEENMGSRIKNNLDIFFDFMENLGPKEKIIFWKLNSLFLKNEIISIDQKKLGKIVSCCRGHVSNTIKKFESENYLKIERRGAKKTNIYHGNDIIKIKNLKQLWNKRLSEIEDFLETLKKRNEEEDWM